MIELALSDEANGPGTGGQRLGFRLYARTPGGRWERCAERSAVKLRGLLRALGFEVAEGLTPREKW